MTRREIGRDPSSPLGPAARIAAALAAARDPLVALAASWDDLRTFAAIDHLVLCHRSSSLSAYQILTIDRPHTSGLVYSEPPSFFHPFTRAQPIDDDSLSDAPNDIADLAAHSGVAAPFDGPSGWRAWLLGLTAAPGPIVPHQVATLDWLAELFASALAHHDERLVSDAHAHLRRLLEDRESALGAMPDIASIVRSAVGADRLSIWARGADNDVASLVFADRIRIPEIDDARQVRISDHTPMRLAVERGQPVVVSIDSSLPVMRYLHAAGIRTAMVCPLLTADDLQGFIIFNSTLKNAYRERDALRLGSILHTLALAFSLDRQRSLVRDERDQYADLFERAPEMLLMLDHRGHVVDANRVMIEALGRPRTDVVGQLFTSFLAPESATLFTSTRSRIANEGKVVEVELRLERPKGDPLDIVWSSTPTLAGDGTLAYTRDVFRDITATKQLWRERSLRSAVLTSAIRSLSTREVATTVLRVLVDAYEIRAGRIDAWDPEAKTLTPIATMRLPGWESQPQKPIPCANHVARAAIETRGTVVIPLPAPGTITDPALRGLTGTLLLFPLETHARTVGTLALLHPSTNGLSTMDVRILATVASDLAIIIDNTRLYENLDTANRKLVQSQRDALEHDRLAAVGQLSAGMTHQINNPLASILGNLTLLEDKFASSGEARQLIADSLAGVRRIRDVVGIDRGCVFVDERPRVAPPTGDIVPLAPSPTPTPPQQPRLFQPPETEVAPPRPQILIVDDEELTLRFLTRLFGRDYNLLLAASGAQALEVIAQSDHPPALILCDLMMPDMTGIDLYNVLEFKYPALAGKILFFTGGAFTQEARDFIERMAGRVFFKPLEIEQIRRIVRERTGTISSTGTGTTTG